MKSVSLAGETASPWIEEHQIIDSPVPWVGLGVIQAAFDSSEVSSSHESAKSGELVKGRRQSGEDAA
jgi:hypothetical protein